jgi:hypothetical protein
MKERKAFKKNKGLVKRLFSFVLALALVLNMGQIMPGSTVEAAENYQVTFHYKNVKNYGKLNLYVWTGSGTNHAGGWPGTAMTENEDNAQWYDLTLTVPATTVKYIVNNKDGVNTAIMCEQLYDLALLSHTSLTPEQMTNFITRSNKIMELLAK